MNKAKEIPEIISQETYEKMKEYKKQIKTEKINKTDVTKYLIAGKVLSYLI